MASSTSKTGTSYGPELLIRLRGGRRRAQLEDRLRELVRDGTLPAGIRLPSSRSLAGDLEVSRRLVVEAYAQLLAEGYLVARRGGGTYVAATAGSADGVSSQAAVRALQFDFFPGAPDLASFPRTLWARALRDVLRSAPASAFAYPDGRGAPELRRQLAAYLRRVRGVVADPDAIVVCAGATQGLALLGRALVHLGRSTIAVEDPGLPPHRAVLAYAGLQVRGVPVDEEGLDVAALDAPAVVATPAHHCPTGVALSPRRRGALIQWARAGGLVIEDDYDAEFRYDRAPLGALQGLAPEHVVYLGTVSKTLAPGLRLGWLVLPPSLFDAVLQAKVLDDLGSATIDQLALARLIETADYDRHLRKVRRHNRARRDALAAAVARELPRTRVSGISAGLHALVRLPYAVDAQRLLTLAAERSVGVYPLSVHMVDPPVCTDAVVLGYANLAEPAIEEGVRRLAQVLENMQKEASHA
ncbi:MAG TPA: PLP-dependent aminotransferase family protein [Solirubrobacteraceae bacterium]|nr:PLP-dependent aminotransferase family protein [Solirubrobacteraceae bacterium]